MSLRSLSDKALLSQTSRLTRRERETTLEILKHLNEIERRGLHLRLGHSSLFTYCTEHLGYSASGAGRRVQVARCIRRVPQAGRLLKRGGVNLTSLAMIARSLTPENAKVLLARIDGKTQREVEAVAAELRPLSRVPDRVKPVCVRVPVGTHGPNGAKGEGVLPGVADAGLAGIAGADEARGEAPDGARGAQMAGPGAGALGSGAAGRGHSHNGSSSDSPNTQLLRKMLIQFAANTEFMRKVEKVRSLLSTKIPAGATFEQIFEAGLDAFIEKHDPEARAERRAKRTEKQSQKQSPQQAADAIATNERAQQRPSGSKKEPSRYIPPVIRDAVYVRDGGRCTYQGATGRRCGSRHNLHIDHLVPFANGGTNALSNLRLLCANHNWMEAERVLGPVVQQYARRE